MPTNMTHSSVEPSTPPARMATRSKNATTHPGAILRDGRTHWSKEEIDEAKKLKNAQTAAKEQKKAEKVARKVRGEANLARLEEAEDARIANTDTEFPRQRLKKSLSYSSLCLVINSLFRKQ